LESTGNADAYPGQDAPGLLAGNAGQVRQRRATAPAAPGVTELEPGGKNGDQQTTGRSARPTEGAY